MGCSETLENCSIDGQFGEYVARDGGVLAETTGDVVGCILGLNNGSLVGMDEGDLEGLIVGHGEGKRYRGLAR